MTIRDLSQIVCILISLMFALIAALTYFGNRKITNEALQTALLFAILGNVL